MSDPIHHSAELTEQHTLEASFGLLEICLQQLARIAPVTDARQLVELIPPIPRPSQQLILVELIKFDLAAGNCRRLLEFYWPAVADILSVESR